MSGSVIRAQGWQVDGEEQYLTVSPDEKTVSLYQTNSHATIEEENIVKISENSSFEGIQCIQYSSATPGLTAIGQIDGRCLIFDLKNNLTLPAILKPLQSRSCNSVSFNENGLIALGYDRGRQDHSIHVWDINNIQRGDFTGKTSKIFSCISNESISSLSFCPAEPKNFVTGSYKLLREFDIRSNQPLYQIATRCTMNITVNPFSPFMFASHSEDGSFAVWDRRKLNEAFKINNAHQNVNVFNEGPSLLFPKLLTDFQRRTNGSPYRFSSVQTGEIGALFDGDLVRRWKIGTVPPLESELFQYDEMLKQNKKENPNFIPKVSRPSDSFFISKVHDTKTKYERVISFDYAPSKGSDYGIDLVCMRQSGSIYKMRVVDSQNSVVFNSYNDISFAGPQGVASKFVKDKLDKSSYKTDRIEDKLSGLNITHGENEEEREEEDDDDSFPDEEIPDDDMSLSNNQTQLHRGKNIDVYIGTADTMCMISDSFLENDICSKIRLRATKGYGTNSKKNMQILDNINTYETHLHLKNAWKWIDISHDLIQDGKMNYANFDFGYLGVLGIWNMDDDYMIFNRYTGLKNATSRDVMNAAKGIVERRSKECQILAKPVTGFNGKSTKEIQRRLAMYVIGWDFGVRELDEKYKSLLKTGNYERAAGWAIFHGDIDRAVSILGGSNNKSYKIMSTAIAAYSAFKDTTTNNTWKDSCRDLADKLEDPYLKIIFAFIADGNWWDVLNESALPLRERLGVALRFLPDSELDIYLNKLANEVIDRGDVEGIILTGITLKGVNLLQSFVDRENDIQTACLIASFACPKYFTDDRVETWVDTYRSLLNSWSLFSARAKFDIARTKLSKKENGQASMKFIPRQLYLQCLNCHKSIAKDTSNDDFNNNTNSKKSRKNNNHACHHCGYPLPRCAICLITQGIPVPKEIMHLSHDSHNSKINDDRFESTAIKSGASNPSKNELQFKEWFSFCLTCNHCMHAGHAEEWFSKHYVCPVPDCECKCNNR